MLDCGLNLLLHTHPLLLDPESMVALGDPVDGARPPLVVWHTNGLPVYVLDRLLS